MTRLARFRILVPPALLAASCMTVPATPDYGRALPEGVPALIRLRPDEPRPGLEETWSSQAELLPALDRSIQWTRLEYAKQFFPTAGISYPRALTSLERFRELLTTSQSGAELAERVNEEFDWYKSAGWDGEGGGVLFTGYFTPILDGRMEADEVYRYPLYALPEDLEKSPDGTILGQRTAGGLQPYPTRQVIEASGMLSGRGLELVWLRDPLDAFIAHVNGSAFVRLADGTLHRLGYAGKNGQAYTSIGAELIEDGAIQAEELSLSAIRRWARNHPEQVEEYLDRNDSYVFFTPIEGNPRGSLNVEVSPERTLATDKRLFPRGALVFVETNNQQGTVKTPLVEKMMLDQDTGGAIRTAGRADIYYGVGEPAEARAGATRLEGQLYYLFLKE